MIRRSLRWSLGASAALAVLVIASIDAPGAGDDATVRAVEREPEPAAPVSAGAAIGRPSGLADALPSELAPVRVGAAGRDLFAPASALRPARAVPSAPVVPAAAPPTPAVAPPPAAPRPAYRYAGSMTGPDGQRHTWLGRSDGAVRVEPGQQLDDGYRVDGVTAEAISLSHAGQGTSVSIPVPIRAAAP